MSHNIEIFGGLRFLQARCYRTVRTPQGRPCKRAGRERDNFLFKFLLVKLHTWRAIQATTLKLLEVITKSEKATGVRLRRNYWCSSSMIPSPCRKILKSKSFGAYK